MFLVSYMCHNFERYTGSCHPWAKPSDHYILPIEALHFATGNKNLDHSEKLSLITGFKVQTRSLIVSEKKYC